jgi:hypothetical protein
MAIWNIKLALGALIAAITLIVGGAVAYHSVHASPPQQTVAVSPEKGTNAGDDATADTGIEALRSRLLLCQSGRFAKIKPDGSGLTQVGGELKKDLERVHRHRVSPDGKSVAFLYETRKDFKTGPGMVMALWAFDEPWPGKVLLAEEPPTSDQFYTLDFFWMPDGKQLVLCKYQKGKDDKSTIFKYQMLDAETLKVTDLKVPEGHRLSDISADGKWFLTVKDTDPKKWDEGAELYRVERSTGEARKLFDGLPTTFFWQWRIAPDGTKVAGMKSASAHWFQLFVGDLATGKFNKVTHEPNSVGMFYGWSRDGKKLLYSIQDGETSKPTDMIHNTFITVDADGKNRAELYHAQGSTWRVWVEWR